MKTILALLYSLLAFKTFSQFWQGTGNPACPAAQCVGAATNFLGTATGNNTAIHFGVNGSSDVWIDNLNGVPQLQPGNTGGHWIGLGRIFQPAQGAGSGILTPRAHLHIHGGNTTNAFGFAGGLRTWFQTGTLYTENSDGMYVGLRTLGANQTYAVINWTDDAFGTSGSDFLIFNFTGGDAPLIFGIQPDTRPALN